MLRRRRRSFFARPRLLEEGRVFCVPVAASLVHPEGRRRFIGGAMPASARSSQQDAGIGEVRGSVGCAIHVYIYINSPKGPEPALGFFEKNPGLSHSCREATKQQQQKFSPNEPGGRANVFYRFTLLLLRQRYVFVYVTLP
jgi:hypothetical protein